MLQMNMSGKSIAMVTLRVLTKQRISISLHGSLMGRNLP